MGTSRGQDRSLGSTDSGMTLPKWIKGRVDSRYDFDQSSFSPPSHDDNFFCIRYSSLKSSEKRDNNLGCDREGEGYMPISQVLSENKNLSGSADGQVNAGSSNISSVKEIKNIDFSKHPLPCQPFVPTAEGKEKKQQTAPTAGAAGFVTNKLKIVKSQGTDDGFHSEPALCGKSIVDVASRIMSGKVMKIDTANDATEVPNKSSSRNYNEPEQFLRMGNSKSLPVTPIASPTQTPDTSPKSRRRTQANRYFTIPERDKYQTGWILSSILGQSRDLMGTGKIQEVDEEESPAINDIIPSKYLNRKKSISSQNLSYLGKNENSAISTSSQQQQHQSKETQIVNTNVFQAKPSELREMNFWSPTSM